MTKSKTTNDVLPEATPVIEEIPASAIMESSTNDIPNSPFPSFDSQDCAGKSNTYDEINDKNRFNATMNQLSKKNGLIGASNSGEIPEPINYNSGNCMFGDVSKLPNLINYKELRELYNKDCTFQEVILHGVGNSDVYIYCFGNKKTISRFITTFDGMFKKSFSLCTWSEVLNNRAEVKVLTKNLTLVPFGSVTIGEIFNANPIVETPPMQNPIGKLYTLRQSSEKICLIKSTSIDHVQFFVKLLNYSSKHGNYTFNANQFEDFSDCYLVDFRGGAFICSDNPAKAQNVEIILENILK